MEHQRLRCVNGHQGVSLPRGTTIFCLGVTGIVGAVKDLHGIVITTRQQTQSGGRVMEHQRLRCVNGHQGVSLLKGTTIFCLGVPGIAGAVKPSPH